MCRSLRWVLAFAGAVNLLSASDEVQTVCSLLRDAELRHGQIVKVRGTYHADSEGSDVADSACRKQLLIKGQEWSPGLWLVTPGDELRIPEPVKFDNSSYRRLVDAATMARSRGETVTAVFQGRIEFCPVLRSIRLGYTRWIGCGHMAAYAAQLVVQSVTDIVIESEKGQEKRR